MDNSLLEKLYEIGDDFDTEENKTSVNLYTVITKMSKMLFNGEYDELIRMKRILDDELIGKDVIDRKSYNLGKAHAIIELMNGIRTCHQEKEMSEKLSENEITVLREIGEKRDSTFSELIEGTEIAKDELQNILRFLINHYLITESKMPKYRWFHLSVHGENVLTIIDKGDKK